MITKLEKLKEKLKDEEPQKIQRAVKIKKETLGPDMGRFHEILIKPLVTEKVTDLAGQNKYAFVVKNSCNKIEIKRAIKNIYGVEPIKINTLNMQGKNVRYGRTQGRTKNWKKVIITLKEGEKIELYKGV